MNKHYCIVNFENSKILSILENYGYNCIPTIKSDNISQPISNHADVLYLKTDNNEIYVSSCQSNNYKLLHENKYKINPISLNIGYKYESKLNIVITENKIICNTKTCMDISKIKKNREIVLVNQGYTKCSTIVVNNNCFITEDIGIYNKLNAIGAKCLLIEKGYVKLDGYDYGFIGGASTILNSETLLFFGDITQHPQYNNIITFCKYNNIEVDYIKDMPLTDIGGIVEI